MMETAKGEGRYELRGLELYVNGEPQGAGRKTVMLAVARYWRETGGSVQWIQGTAQIPELLGNLIVFLKARETVNPPQVSHGVRPC